MLPDECPLGQHYQKLDSDEDIELTTEGYGENEIGCTALVQHVKQNVKGITFDIWKNNTCGSLSHYIDAH